MTLLGDLELLGVNLDDVTMDDLKARYHALVQQHHPDHGGDPELFDKLTQAYKRAKSRLSQPRTCEVCGGTGRVAHSRGFYTLSQRCAACNGKGQRTL